MRIYGRPRELSVLRSIHTGSDASDQRLLVWGGAGSGKTALLDFVSNVIKSDDGPRVMRTAGVKTETTLPYAALGRMLRPFVQYIDQLPRPQAETVRVVVGLASPPGFELDRVHLCHAVVGLLNEVSRDGRVLCVIDDTEWLDWVSADALAFAAQRLPANVHMIFAAGDCSSPPVSPLLALPELRLRPLDRCAARQLLTSSVSSRLVPDVEDRILDEAGGNPRAIVELGRALTPDECTGRACLDPLHLAALPVRTELVDDMSQLPARVRTVLTLLAVDHTGRVDVVAPAARALGAGSNDLARAERAGLVTVSGHAMEFRHPLGRQGAYQCSDVHERHAAHGALADVFSAMGDDASATLHRCAAATDTPNDILATALERNASGSRPRQSAVVTSHIRSAQLSRTDEERARRLAEAAVAKLATGQVYNADRLADRATTYSRDASVVAKLAVVRAEAEVEHGSYREAAIGLLNSVDCFPSTASDERTAALVTACRYAWISGSTATVAEAATLVGDLTSGPAMRAAATGIRGCADLLNGDVASGLAAFRDMARLVSPADGEYPGEVRLLAALSALLAGDAILAQSIAWRLVASNRVSGRLLLQPDALHVRAMAELALGRHDAARQAGNEAIDTARRCGREVRNHHVGLLAKLAAIEGNEEGCQVMVESIQRDDGMLFTPWAASAMGLLDLSLGRYEAARLRLTPVAETPFRYTIPGISSVPDCVEAAALSGEIDLAEHLLDSYDEYVKHADQPWMNAVALRCRALLSSDNADELFREALDIHRLASRPFEHARTELGYGEWLRRRRRSIDSRRHIRAAYEAFTRLGAAIWADRARSELRAAGESPGADEARVRSLDVQDRARSLTTQDRVTSLTTEDRVRSLTTQELQVVRRAAAGLSNQAIADDLRISPRTVGYHMWKAFPKLGISKRIELVKLDLTP